MVAQVNPTKARYFPEELPEAIVITPSVSGTSIASYGSFSPYTINLKKIWTGQTPGITLRIDIDSGHATFESPLLARPERLPTEVDLIAYANLDQWAVGPALESYFAYTMKITKPNLFEKIKYGITLTDSETSLAEEFSINKKYQAGILGGSTAPQYKMMYEVAKEVTVTAGGSTRVGRMVNVKKGRKAVLEGISVDRDAVAVAFGGPGADDTFFTLNRDTIDTAHIKLDCLAMPSLDNEIPCYIPATDRHEILIESVTGITDLPVRYRYSVSKISTMEKIKWDISLNSDEKKLADEYDLIDSVAAGIL